MTFADDFVARFEPWLNPDLEAYLRAIAGMMDEVELFAFDTETHEGWTILLDPDRAPVKALPYLAQYVGERLPAGLSEAASREWIKDSPNRRRGTPRSIFYAAQRKLTGSRVVQMVERSDGVIDRLLVVTYTSQTPDPAGVLQDLKDVVPADTQLIYETRSGQSWQDVTDTPYANWAAVAADNATWNDVAGTIGAGSSTFVRS